MCVYSLLWATRWESWVDSPACMFVPVSILAPGCGEETRRRNVSLVPLESTDPLGIYFWSTLLVTLLAALFMCSKNVPVLYTTANVDMLAFQPMMAGNRDLFSQTSSVVTVRPEQAINEGS